MYALTTSLIEKMSDVLQTGKSAPNCRVTVYKGDKGGGFLPFRFELPVVTSIALKRQWNFAADELTVEIDNQGGYYGGYYGGDYRGGADDWKEFSGNPERPFSGWFNAIQPFNKVTCDLGYDEELLRVFTGQIKDIEINENPASLKFTALNAYRKLLKPIDPVTKSSLIYENQTAFSIIQDLCARAGVDSLVFDADSVDGKDFAIEKAEFALGTDYSDAVKEIAEIMNHRVFGGRFGELQVVRNFDYDQGDFHHWEFDDATSVFTGVYTPDASILRNRVIIAYDGGYQAFENAGLIEKCNGEVISSAIEVPWAKTEEQRWAAADKYFLDISRKFRRMSISAVGNPAMDCGDLAKTRMLVSTANMKYTIIAVNTSFTASGYFDQVDLELAARAGGHMCQPAEGDYETPPGEVPENSAVSGVVVTLRDKIVDYAETFLGIYYQWGGNYPESGYGVDCSHFTYQVLKKFGLMDEYKTAANQKNWADTITREELLPGDLVFYTWGGESVKHVVMYIGNGEIIGANGGGSGVTTAAIARNKGAKVKIQPIDYGTPAFFGRVPGLA